MLVRTLLATSVAIAAPLGVLAWLYIAERLEEHLPASRRATCRAYLWLLPALLLVVVFLAWPLLNTLWLSITSHNAAGDHPWSNFEWLATSAEVRSALINNMLWVAGLVVGCLVLGLLVAVLADRVRWESIALSVVVLPTAVSFVCGAVIWGFVYDYQAPGLLQVGTLNAVWSDTLGNTPIAWLVDRRTNNWALIAVGLWSTLGFATVILSAAIKGIPTETLDAANVDGANAWQTFRHVMLPQMTAAIAVVATLVGIMALKAFDIVYVLTNGNYGTNVIANVLYGQLFVSQDPGRASAVAVLLLLVALPLFVVNALVSRRTRDAA